MRSPEATNPVRPSGSIADWAIVLAFIAGFVIAGIIWFGAVAATTIAGRSTVGLSPAATPTAIVRLLQHPGRPDLAWTKAAPAAVPGPILYWPVTLAASAATITIGTMMWLLWRRHRPTKRRLGVDAHARFAHRKELAPLLIREPKPGRLVLGTWNGRLVATESQRWDPPDPPSRLARLLTAPQRHARPGDVTSVAIVGPSGSGKTSECAIPAVLDWHGPAILLSVKRDLLDATIKRRRQLGNVKVFDPTGLIRSYPNAGVPILETEIGKWSPLRNAATAQGAQRAGDALAAWTPQAGVEGGMNFWTSQGKTLFTGLLGAAALTTERSMGELAQWVFTIDRPRKGHVPGFVNTLDFALKAANPAIRQAAEQATLSLHSIWNSPDDKMIGSVYATARTVVDPYRDPAVIAATDLEPGEQWIDLDWLMNTGPDGTRANTLYLVVDVDDFKRLAPVLGAFLSDLKTQVYQWDVAGRKMPAPLLMLIDEAGQIPLEWLPQAAATCRGVGLQLVTIWQSIAQIHEAYGKLADSVLTNHPTKLFFPGASDDATLGYHTKIIGDEETERYSWSATTTGNTNRSISGQHNKESFVPYHVPRLAAWGQAVMIHANTPPAVIHGRQWWKDPRLTRLATGTEPNPAPTSLWIPTPPAEESTSHPARTVNNDESADADQPVRH